MKDLETTGKNKIRSLLMAVALTAVAFSKAWGAEPRAEILLMSDVLTVGDLFEGVAGDAAYVLAPAPAHGRVLTLSASDLVRVSETFNLGWAPKTGLEQSVVRRDGREIGAEAIRGVLSQEISTRMPGRKFDIQLSSGVTGFFLPSSASAKVGIEALKYDPAGGNFRATVTAGGESLDVSGRMHPVTEVPVLARALRSGDIITEGDLAYVDLRSDELSSSTIISGAHLVGQTPRRTVAAMQPLSESDIMPPELVQKGKIVTMTLKNGAFELTAQGRALESGSEGETVRILNTSSNVTVEAVVTGPQTVSVAGPAQVVLGGL